MTRKLRSGERTVLHVVANLDRGGAQEVVRTLARNLSAHGWRAVVATLKDGPLRAEIEADGVAVEVVPGRRHSVISPLAAAAEVIEIRRRLSTLCDRYLPAVVQTHLLRSLDFLVLSLRRRRPHPAILWTVHNALLDLRPDQLPVGQRWLLSAKRTGYRAAYRFGGRLVDGFVAVSDDVAGAVSRAYRTPPDRLFTIPNGVETDRLDDLSARKRVREELGLPDDSRLLIVVAKLYLQKGHGVLLDALSQASVPPDVHVLLVGDGPERPALERQAARLRLRSVHFLGVRPDVPRLLVSSDLFVLPSLWEGLPMALLEAMAAGLPVVASDVAGSRQVIVDGESGLLVPPGDPEVLAEAIIGLLANPVRASNMGRAARERVVAFFSAAVQAARHAEVYEALTRSQTGDIHEGSG